MLLDVNADHVLVVEGVQIVIPTKLGIPLGFIVNELITNAVKHADGRITVRLDTTPRVGHSLSVSNNGPGLPDGFHPDVSKGLGMKIIQSLIRQIDGSLRIGQGPDQQGACFKVFFPATVSIATDRADESRRPIVRGTDTQSDHASLL
jgi:two-component sensor histidine kinase